MSLVVTPLETTVDTGVDLPCRSYESDLWFAETPADLEAAKSLCNDCPLRIECLAGALDRHEPWGVWGGEIFDHGAIVPRKRPRGRPRKEDLARDAVARAQVAARTDAVLREVSRAGSAA